MNFQAALTAMQAGHRVRREDWLTGQYMILGVADFLICTPTDCGRPMCVAHWFRTVDLLADDWESADPQWTFTY